MLNSSTTAEQEKMKEEMAQHKRRLELIFTDFFLGLKKLGSSEYGVRSKERTSPAKYMKDTEILKGRNGTRMTSSIMNSSAKKTADAKSAEL